MFDFLRNLTKSDEEKRQERLSAYLDNNLTPQERSAFETELEADSGLQASLAQQRLVKENLSALPRQRAPRNFTLDPALYGRPTSTTLFRLYPVMRTATVLAAIALVFLFSLDFFSPAQESSDIVAQAPIAASETSNNDLSGGAAEPEMLGAAGGNAETVVEESAEEAEEAMMEVEVVEEEEMESAVSVEAEVAEEAAPPAEPEVMEEAIADAAIEEEMPRGTNVTETVTGEAADGFGLNSDPPLTPTQRLTQTTTLTTGGDGFFYSNIPTVKNDQPYPALDETDSSATDDNPVPSRRLLQIGLAVLFVVLLAGTWFVRRQL